MGGHLFGPPERSNLVTLGPTLVVVGTLYIYTFYTSIFTNLYLHIISIHIYLCLYIFFKSSYPSIYLSIYPFAYPSNRAIDLCDTGHAYLLLDNSNDHSNVPTQPYPAVVQSGESSQNGLVQHVRKSI